jgi:hypothetical protein
MHAQGNRYRTHFGGDDEDLFGGRGFVTLIESRKPLSVRHAEEEFLLLQSAQLNNVNSLSLACCKFVASTGNPWDAGSLL